MSDQDKMSIATLKDGAAIQLINEELDRVWENIQDLNTEATKAREVILRIKVKPDKTRQMADLELHVDSKLSPCRAEEARVNIGMQGGYAVATEWRSPQTDMEAYIDNKVTKLQTAAEGGGEG